MQNGIIVECNEKLKGFKKMVFASADSKYYSKSTVFLLHFRAEII
jgi:N-dimethylarginine dimethylaminohydrolase